MGITTISAEYTRTWLRSQIVLRDAKGCQPIGIDDNTVSGPALDALVTLLHGWYCTEI